MKKLLFAFFAFALTISVNTSCDLLDFPIDPGDTGDSGSPPPPAPPPDGGPDGWPDKKHNLSPDSIRHYAARYKVGTSCLHS